MAYASHSARGRLFRNGERQAYWLSSSTSSTRAQIPVIAEPLFQQLHSTVEFIPVMNADDLQRGLAQASP